MRTGNIPCRWTNCPNHAAIGLIIQWTSSYTADYFVCLGHAVTAWRNPADGRPPVRVSGHVLAEDRTRCRHDPVRRGDLYLMDRSDLITVTRTARDQTWADTTMAMLAMGDVRGARRSKRWLLPLPAVFVPIVRVIA